MMSYWVYDGFLLDDVDDTDDADDMDGESPLTFLLRMMARLNSTADCSLLFNLASRVMMTGESSVSQKKCV